MPGQLAVGCRVKAIVARIARRECAQLSPAQELGQRLHPGVWALVACHGSDVDKVQGSEMVKVENVRLDKVGAKDQVAHNAAVVGDLVGDAKGAVQV